MPLPDSLQDREGVESPEWAARMLKGHLEQIKINPDDHTTKDLASAFIRIIAHEYKLKDLT